MKIYWQDAAGESRSLDMNSATPDKLVAASREAWGAWLAGAGPGLIFQTPGQWRKDALLGWAPEKLAGERSASRAEQT